MKPICLMASLIISSVGCGQGAPPAPASTEETVRSPNDVGLREKPLHEPLTQGEVLAFIELVEAFPDSQLPAFSPSVTPESIEGLSPEQAVKVWRATLRSTLTPKALIGSWQPRAAERRVLTERKVTPKALASLMLRLSSAWVAESLEQGSSLSSARRKAEQSVAILIHQIELAPRNQTRDVTSLWSALEESTMLAEYLALLSEIPDESRAIVSQHRQDLAAILPDSANITAPPEQREDSRMIPVGYDVSSPLSDPKKASPPPSKDLPRGWKIK